MRHGVRKLQMSSDNRGSTIVIVIIALSFVLILAASLLFASYTNYMMKVTDRGSKQNQYNAETVLNEIRIGIQQVASDAIADAYTDVLVDYNAAVDTENAFKKYFVASLKDYQVKYKNGALEYFIIQGENKCNLDAIESFITDPDGVTLSGGSVYIPDDSSSPIEIRSLTVDYVKNGYRSSISTDINIKMPEFTYTLSELILSSVPDYTVIANVSLTQTIGGSLTVDGNAYAGQINVSGTGNTMNIGIADNFVCNGTLEVKDGSGFYCGVNSSIWTRDIVAGSHIDDQGARIELSGDTYVADDMELQNSSDASISGRYFGFGNSLTNPKSSSSIIINGKKTKLSFSSMKNLTLAGNCFIDGRQSDTDSTGYVLMGESISVKSNQLAYLIPQSCLTGGVTNPMIRATNNMPTVETLKNYVERKTILWETNTLESYIDDIQIVYYSLGNNQTLVYFYMQFGTVTKANKYFLDYFNHNKSEIEKYLPLYAEGINLLSSVSRSIAGNVITYTNEQVGLIEASAMVSTSTCQRLSTMYENLCATLNSSIAGAEEGSTVYDYIVNAEEIDRLTSENTYFKNSAGKNLAVICKGNTSISNYDDIKIVIATGNVTIDKKDFTGLVISGGTVFLNQSLKADREGVTEAFNATTFIDGNNITLMEFLKLGSESLKLPNIAIGAIDWDLERIVVFENWSKN